VWADNETELDLLGFSFLVDTLVVGLTEPRLLPVTVGVLGDWGSGKSSLMHLAARALEGEPPIGTDQDTAPYIVVEFSPWQHEDYDDVKVALMRVVLDAVARRVPAEEQARVGRLREFLRRLRPLGRRAARVAEATSSAAVAAAMPDLDPATASIVSNATQAVLKELGAALDRPPRSEQNGTTMVDVDDVRSFRAEFKALLESASDVSAVVVFIDDLDRCLPETIVDTFEAIRLFLNEPKTAYVLALNPSVVESAIDARYPDIQKDDGAGVGRDYLEKIIQLQVTVPPLAAPEVESYANLLFAELHLKPALFARVLERAEEGRSANALSVVFNAGIAADVLGAELPVALADDLAWAAQITPVLAASLRGNPRQLKRFLNTLLLKKRSAERRAVELQLPILAKLLVLEELHHADFQILFDWHTAAGGASPQLADAEAAARALTEVRGEVAETGGAESDDQVQAQPGTDDGAREWAAKPHIAQWLRVEPALAGTDLGPYFTYSRERLLFGLSASRLAPHLQQLLTKILGEQVERARRLHLDAAAALEPADRGLLAGALLERVQAAPSVESLAAAIELAERCPDVTPLVCSGLAVIPARQIKVPTAVSAVRRLPAGDPSVDALLTSWATAGVPPVQKAIETARGARATRSSRGH
jgi:hypothetical protein